MKLVDTIAAFIDGIAVDTDLPRLARAALESTAYQVADAVAAMVRSGVAVSELVVDGGGSANDALRQFRADPMGRWHEAVQAAAGSSRWRRRGVQVADQDSDPLAWPRR